MTNLFGRVKTSSLRLVANKKTEEHERKKKGITRPRPGGGVKSLIYNGNNFIVSMCVIYGSKCHLT